MTREEVEQIREQGVRAAAGAGAGGAVGAAMGVSLSLFLGFLGLAVAPVAAGIIGGATALTAGVGAIRGARGEQERPETEAGEEMLCVSADAEVLVEERREPTFHQ